MPTSLFTQPHVAHAGSTDPHAPLVVLLHGRGSTEDQIIGLAEALPPELAYTAVRAPIAEGSGYAWFANRGIGRPVAESLEQTMDWFHHWLDQAIDSDRDVMLVGFSGGAAFAGGLILDRPQRFAGAAILYGTLPFDAGVSTAPGRLAALPIFLALGDNDNVIPADLQARTWEYLHGASGAATYSHRDDAGHGVSPHALQQLAGWLRQRAAWVAEHGVNPAGTRDVVWPTLDGGQLPVRRGPAPTVSTTIPQQQLTQTAPEALQERLFEYAATLSGVACRESVISVPGARAFVLDEPHARGTHDCFIVPEVGEFAHLHPAYDGSLHVALPQDLAADAIAKGWSVTHMYAGLYLAPGMVMVFGPRDEEELAVVSAIVTASYQYATRLNGQ